MMMTRAAVLRGSRSVLKETELGAPGVVIALSVNEAASDGWTHGNVTWSATQAGVARELT